MSLENVAPEPVTTKARPPTPVETLAPAAENVAAVTMKKTTANAALEKNPTQASAAAAAKDSTAPAEASEITKPTKKTKRASAEDKTEIEKKSAEDTDGATTNEPHVDENQAEIKNSLKSDKLNPPVDNIVIDETGKRTGVDDELLDELKIDESFDDAMTDDLRSFKSGKSIKNVKKREIDTDLDQLADIGSINELETESDTVSVCSYILQKSLEIEPDFFDNFGEIPSLAELSLDVSEEDDGDDKKMSAKVDDSNVDRGHFVNPLTGERESSVSEQPEPEPEPVVDEEEEEEAEEEEEDLLLPPDIEVDVTLAPMEEDTFDMWFQAAPKAVRIDEGLEIERIARLEYERQVYDATVEFLDKLIAETVESCEYVDTNTILRQSLDKKKLMEELILKVSMLDVEQKARFFLNRKTVEFFRRKKAFRSITEDDPDTIKEALEKYKVSTTLLDHLISQEAETRFATERQTQDLEFEAFEKEEEVKNCIVALEDMIKKALHRDNSEHLKAVIANQLSKMAEQRKEISNVRFMLIQRQHTLAALAEKLKALENIGEGLSLRDHALLQTDILNLTKKNEDRNTELIKCRMRCNADLHIMAHIKDKKQMLHSRVLVQEQALEELLKEKQHYREQIFHMKIYRGKIRDEINHMSFQGGLIDKPALMYDFDETVERLLNTRKNVENMRQRYNDVQHKITVLEGKCI